MLLELYIAILVMNLIAFGIAFFRKSVWMWAFSLVLSGILIFASYDIVQNTAVVTNQTSPSPGVIHYEYSIQTSHTEDLTFSYLSIGLFLLGLVLFLNDLFIGLKDQNLGDREL
jgi:hypothetical protein